MFKGYNEMDSSVSVGSGLEVEESLALDFVNTNDWHASEKPIERLKDYADLVGWAERVDLIKQADAAEYRRLADSHPTKAKAVLERARGMREALYRLFTAHIQDRPTNPADIALMNPELPAALA